VGRGGRPRNKSVVAQRKNELNHNFARGNEFRPNHFQKNLARVKGRASRGWLILRSILGVGRSAFDVSFLFILMPMFMLMLDSPDHDSRFTFLPRLPA
jgi:hypothetical protein